MASTSANVSSSSSAMRPCHSYMESAIWPRWMGERCSASITRSSFLCAFRIPIESFTASLHPANSLLLIIKYDRCANCLQSRTCHHYQFSAIIGPHLAVRTHECIYKHSSAQVLACVRRRRLLHLPVNIQPVQVSYSHLFIELPVSLIRWISSS